jgi:hypothetical protein
MMALRELTTETTEDGKTIRRAAGRIADHSDRTEQSEWIEFQVAVDVPTVRSGALLRMQVLRQVSEITGELAHGFEQIAPPS